MKRFVTCFSGVLWMILLVGVLFSCDIERIVTTYTVTFELDGGEAIDALVFEKGQMLTVPVPEKTGHAFLGWFFDAEGMEALTSDSFPVMTDVILYAAWEVLYYTLTWVPENGELPLSVVLPYGSALSYPDDPVRDEDVFLGWFEGTSHVLFAETVMPAHDVTVTARWYRPSILDSLQAGMPFGDNFTYVFSSSMYDPYATESYASVMTQTFMRSGLDVMVLMETMMMDEEDASTYAMTLFVLSGEGCYHSYTMTTFEYWDGEDIITENPDCWEYKEEAENFIETWFENEMVRYFMQDMLSTLIPEGIMIDWFDDDGETLTLREAYFESYLSLLGAEALDFHYLIIEYGGSDLEIAMSGTAMDYHDVMRFEYVIQLKDQGTTTFDIPSDLQICEPPPEPEGVVAYFVPIYDFYDYVMMYDVYQSIVHYAEEHNYVVSVYTSTNIEETIAAIYRAVDEGADTIILQSLLVHGNAVWMVQQDLPDVTFILLDNYPSNYHPLTEELIDGDTPDTTIEPHVIGLLGSYYQAGFVAGYTLVQEGYRQLGYLGYEGIMGRSIIYGYGFIEGIEAAAVMLGLEEDAITVQFMLGGFSFTPTTALSDVAQGWYEDGIEVIYSTAWMDTPLIVGVAEAAGGKVMGFYDDFEKITSSALLGSTHITFAETTYRVLNCLEDGSCEGGTLIIADVAWGGIILKLDVNQFETFDGLALEALYYWLQHEADLEYFDVTLSLIEIDLLTPRVVINP